jgi:hypothetical protein
MLKVAALLPVVLLVFSTCTTSSPHIRVTYISEQVNQYYIPFTTWKVKNTKNISARLDITYRSEDNKPAICNISFFDETKMPAQVTNIALVGDGIRYPLNEVQLLLTRQERHEYRITSLISIQDLETVLNAQSIILYFIFDTIEYQAAPQKDFFPYRDQFLTEINF